VHDVVGVGELSDHVDDDDDGRYDGVGAYDGLGRRRVVASGHGWDGWEFGAGVEDVG
jgi:hypothetical protein